MQTDSLIRALTVDHVAAGDWSTRRFLGVVALGWLVSGALFAVMLGPRADLAAVVGDWRFLLKFAVTLTLAATAFGLAAGLARPGAAIRSSALAILLAPAALAAASGLELVLIDPGAWVTRLVGSNAWVCLTAIPSLSIPLLAAALFALRKGAPMRPNVTGAAAGLVAGGLAAALYASHCTDDSPLFVMTWYSIAIGMTALIGGAIGGRVLRW